MEIKITLAEAVAKVTEYLETKKNPTEELLYHTIEIKYERHSGNEPKIEWIIYHEKIGNVKGNNFIIAFESFKTSFEHKEDKEEIRIEQQF